MNNAVPEGWEIREAESLYIRLRVPRVYDRNNVTPVGKYPVLDQSESGCIGYLNSTPEFECDEDSPLTTFANHTCAVRQMEKPFGLIQNVFPLKAQADISQMFLFQILRGAISQDGYKGHYPKLRETQFLTPPLPEQQKIATILSSVDKVIETTRAQIDKLKDLKTGMMQELLSKGIGVDGKPHTEFKDSPVGRIPAGWETLPVKSLLADTQYPMRSGPFGSALLKHELVSTGIPFLGIDNVHVEHFRKSFKRFVTEEKFKDLEKYAVYEGDVMVTIMGTVGRCCVVPEGTGKALSSKHVWTISLEQEKYFPDILCWQINFSDWVKQQFKNESQGGVMDSISSVTLKNLLIPVPPIAEQIKISRLYQSISARIQNTESKLETAVNLKKALMQDLLTGNVRVIIDNTEKEPALA